MGAILGVAVAGAAVFWGLTLVARGDFLSALVFMGFAVAMVLALALAVITMRGWITPRASFSAAGIKLEMARSVTWLGCAAAMIILPSCGVGAALAMMGDLDLPLQSDRPQGFIAALMGVAALGALTILSAVITRGGLGSVLLTRKGLTITERRRTREARWTEVRKISDDGGGNRRQNPIQIELTDGTILHLDGATSYTPKGAALYWMVRHYWKHPEHRAELTDERALARFHRGDFDTA
ncbi:hypothetical protein [Mycolicibacterium sp. F2034L]|uniref:hypothetical protein n=1 Tax=Mycolicibacterium sp. F2034L TaxID=2926422 RepID=UPI001FF573E9|nr:hypothetical protein [Mycolicibacterium sp. F2034L]MCK0176681.1 hypothetical protein [Mycolicibacterium sp. F2034L]